MLGLSLFTTYAPVEVRSSCKLAVKLGLAGGDEGDTGGGYLGWGSSDLPFDQTGPSAGTKDPNSQTPAFASGRDDWTVLSVVGGAQSRSQALLEPFKALRMPPVVSIATRVSFLHNRRPQSGSTAASASHTDTPPVGLVFCGAGSLALIGTPFHIEGPFLQVEECVQSRQLPTIDQYHLT